MTPPSGDGNGNGNGKKKRGPPPSDEKLARDKVEALLNVPFPLADYAPILNTILPKPMRITQPPTNDPHRLALLAQGHPFLTIPQTAIASTSTGPNSSALVSATPDGQGGAAMDGARNDDSGDEEEVEAHGSDLDSITGDEEEK